MQSPIARIPVITVYEEIESEKNSPEPKNEFQIASIKHSETIEKLNITNEAERCQLLSNLKQLEAEIILKEEEVMGKTCVTKGKFDTFQLFSPTSDLVVALEGLDRVSPI
jgi:hypothetical protein